MIRKVDHSILGFDAFISIKVLAPQANEMELSRGFKGDIMEMDVASRWVHELQVIPNFMARFECLEFERNFEKQFSDLQKIVMSYKDFCDFMVDSVEIKKLLRILLDAGNIVNTGTRRGNVYGFKVSLTIF